MAYHLVDQITWHAFARALNQPDYARVQMLLEVVNARLHLASCIAKARALSANHVISALDLYLRNQVFQNTALYLAGH